MTARRQLRERVRLFTQEVVAGKIGVSQQVISKWCKSSTPRAFHQAMLEVVWGINRDDWFTAKQRHALEDARQERDAPTVADARATLQRHGVDVAPRRAPETP